MLVRVVGLGTPPERLETASHRRSFRGGPGSSQPVAETSPSRRARRPAPPASPWGSTSPLLGTAGPTAGASGPGSRGLGLPGGGVDPTQNRHLDPRPVRHLL